MWGHIHVTSTNVVLGRRVMWIIKRIGGIDRWMVDGWVHNYVAVAVFALDVEDGCQQHTNHTTNYTHEDSNPRASTAGTRG